MTPEQYITENYENIKLWLKNVTQGNKQHLYEDLIHEVIIIFLEHDRAQEAVDTGTVRYFLTRIALNQWRSNTSPFHYQYRDSFLDFPDYWADNIEDNGEYDTTEDIMTEMVTDALDALYQGTSNERYQAIMIIMYYTMGANYSAVGRHLNIPHTTVRKIVLRGTTKLKQIIFNNINNGKLNQDNRISTDFSNSWDDYSSGDKQQAISVASKLLQSKYFNSN